MQLSKSFTREEFKCNCNVCDYDTVDAELITLLQALRDHFKAPITITSGNRCPAYNKQVGGSKNSYHIRGRAADIQIAGVSPLIVQDYLKATYPNKYGIGRYSVFTHIDTRTNCGCWNG